MGDGSRIVCFGELLLRLDAPGRERLLQSPLLRTHFGGAEANVAVSLAILGHDSAVVSTLPDNALGHACAGQLRRHGVDTAGLRFDEGRMGLYFLSPGAMHRPSEVLYDRADSAFACAPANAYDWPDLLAGVAWLHVSGITAALGDPAARAVLAAMRMARKSGTCISFDCNYRCKLWGGRAARAANVLRELADEVDLLFGDDRDMALILGMDFTQEHGSGRFRAAAEAAFDAWPRLRWMAATGRRQHSVDDHEILGMLATSRSMRVTDAYTLDSIVDRMGAGDAFAAGLLHGLARGMDDSAALDFAIAACCLKHAIPGDFNLSSEQEIQALVDNAGFGVKR